MTATHLAPQTSAATSDLRALAVTYLQAIWRRRWIVVIVSWIVCCVGWAGIAFVPNKYESSGRIYVNADTLLQPLLQGIALNTDPSRQVEYLRRTLLSRPNLQQLVHLAGLDSRPMTSAQKDAQLDGLARTIKISQQTQSLFTISYDAKNPIVAKNVVQGMITIFSEAAAGSSRSEMDNAQNFLNDQIAKYQAKLMAADQRRAAFREKYAEILPDLHNGGNQLQSARMAVRQAQLQLNDAVAKRDSLRRQLTSVPPVITVDQAAPVIITNGIAAPSTAEAMLQQAENRLSTLLLTDTNQHPDVIAERRQIAILKAEVAAEKKEKKGQGAPVAAGSQQATTSNPVYTQLKLKLADADTTVASFEEQLQEATAQENRIQKLIRQAPNIELQAENLDRDYGILKKDYEELVSRKQSAEIAQAADTQADRIQFRVVDPPQIPLRPASPNRPLLFSVILIVGVGGGAGFAFLLAQLDRSFSTLSSLRALALPVLGSISAVELFESRRRQLVQFVGFGTAMFALLVAYGVLLMFSLGLFRGVI